MKTNTYSHLENLAASKGVVCERRGRKIELTTPNGGTTAECTSVTEALDTMRTDSTFSDLPVQLNAGARTASPVPSDSPAAPVAPRITIEIIWERDNDATWDIESPDLKKSDYRAWQSEVRASAIVGGKSYSASAYLGGTWEKRGDHPSKSNPEISGYLPQMRDEAIEELKKLLPSPTGFPRQETSSIETRKRDVVVRIADWTKDRDEPAYDVEVYVHGVYDFNESKSFTTRSSGRSKQEARLAAVDFAAKQIAKHL